MSPPRPDRPPWVELPLGDHLLAESPRWDPVTGRLVWVDILRGVVRSATWSDGAWSAVQEHRSGRMPTAVQPLGGGGLAVAVDGSVRVLGADGAVARTVVVSPGFPEVRTNDMTVDAEGRLLVGLFAEDRVSARGGVVSVDPRDGSVAAVVAGQVTTNGLALTPDGRELYAVDTARGTLTRYALRSGGRGRRDAETERGDRRHGDVVVQHAGPGVLDGIGVGPDGDVWVAVWDAAALHRYTPTGRLRQVLDVPVARPSALALARLDGCDQLVVTTARSAEALGAAAAQPQDPRGLLEPSPEGRLYATPLPD